MNDELRSAAERLRQYAAEDSRGAPYTDWDYMDGSQDSGQRLEDQEAIVAAWLSGHLPDDDEPLTEEWLLAVGFSHDNDYDLSLGRMYWATYDDAAPDFWLAGDVMKHIATRGDVRTLCRALGITLDPMPTKIDPIEQKTCEAFGCSNPSPTNRVGSPFDLCDSCHDTFNKRTTHECTKQRRQADNHPGRTKPQTS